MLMTVSDISSFFTDETRVSPRLSNLISEIERLGVCCINSRESISIAADKYRSYIRLRDYGLNQPKTVLVPDADSIEKSFENFIKWT